jgi:hypothetical protein
MSKERARAREARQAARAAEVARAAAERERRERKAQRRAAVAAKVPTLPPKRRKRFGALPTRTRVGLAVGWLAVQAFAWMTVADGRTRFGIALISLAALPLVVVLTRDPRRSP